MAPEEMILVAVEKPSTDVTVVRVAGTLDRVTCGRLLRVVEANLAEPVRLVVDLSSISRLDAYGLRAMQKAAGRDRRGEARLVLTGLAERQDVLPGSVVEVLAEFDTCACLEDVVAGATPTIPISAGPSNRRPAAALASAS